MAKPPKRRKVTHVYTGPVKSPVLSHMREVAYAPIPERPDTRDQESAISAAEAKRLRKMERNRKAAA